MESRAKMVDPRDEVVHSEEEMTADEDEDLINLQKEYELKKEKLLADRKKQLAASKTFLNGLTALAAKPVKQIDFDKRIFLFDIVGGDAEESNSVDPLSKELLRSRSIPHEQIVSVVQEYEIKVLSVTKALAKITKPEYKEPNYNNWAFVGFITDKSDFLKTSKNEKYLRLKVGNFSHTISVNLFGNAYKRYWKAIVGELVLILNPNIYKHPKGFDFYLSEDINNMLTIGTIKNIVKCQEPQCKTYIDTKFKFCEFHDLKQEKKFLKNKRMELNGSVKLFNPLERTLNEESKIYQAPKSFDSKKYVREDIFQKLGSKRKLQDTKANKKLEEKLLSLLNTPKFEKIGLLKLKTREIEQEKLKKRETHINLKNEFKSLTKGKQINLGMSKLDKLAKRNRWHDTLKELEPQAKSLDPKPDNDDDLNIEFTSNQLSQYKRLKKN